MGVKVEGSSKPTSLGEIWCKKQRFSVLIERRVTVVERLIFLFFQSRVYYVCARGKATAVRRGCDPGGICVMPASSMGQIAVVCTWGGGWHHYYCCTAVQSRREICWVDCASLALCVVDIAGVESGVEDWVPAAPESRAKRGLLYACIM